MGVIVTVLFIPEITQLDLREGDKRWELLKAGKNTGDPCPDDAQQLNLTDLLTLPLASQFRTLSLSRQQYGMHIRIPLAAVDNKSESEIVESEIRKVHQGPKTAAQGELGALYS
jgi:hypothetical protein